MRRIFAFCTALLLTPAFVFAAARTFSELAYEIVQIIDTATITLIVFALVVYFWGLAVNIPHFGDEKGSEKRKALFFWGIVILFVMVSIWGIIQLIQNTLFGNSPYSPATGEPNVPSYCSDFFTCGL